MRFGTLPIILLGWAFTAPASGADAFSFEAEHKRLLRNRVGELTITAEGIAFQAEKGEDQSHRWSFDEIQELRVESPRRIRILSYEDVRWNLNRDRRFTFELIEGEITPEVVVFLAERIPTPLATAVFPEPERVLVRIPAKHGHGLGGGCDGEVIVAEEAVFYLTPHTGHSRWWPLEQIESVGARSEYDFRVDTREGGFHFQLKRPLERRIFEDLWRRLHEPDSWLDSLTGTAEEGSSRSR